MKKIWIFPLLCLACAACNTDGGTMDAAKKTSGAMDASASSSAAAAQEAGSSEEKPDDWQITTKVKAAIVVEPSLSVSARLVSVSTTDGVVTLSGEVPTKEDMDKIVEVAKGIDGVVSVKNEMTVSAAK